MQGDRLDRHTFPMIHPQKNTGLQLIMSDNLRIGQVMQATLKAVLLAQVLGLAGCAPVPYTSEDVALAAQQGQLETLFDQVQAELADARPGSDRALALDTLQNDIGWQLALPHQEKIDELLSEDRKGMLSMAQIAELEVEIATVRRWLPYENPGLGDEVAAARQLTEKQITVVNKELGALSPEQVGQRNVLLLQLADLTGGAEGQVLREQVAVDVEAAYQQGVAAVDAMHLSSAQGFLQQVAAVDLDYKDLVNQQELVATGLFEQNFWRALVDGRPDEAYSGFHAFAETAAFATHRNKVSKDAAELAQYFDALGDKKRRQKHWLESYHAFKKAAYIRARLEIDAAPSTGLQRFTLEMENRFKRAEKAGKTPAALAYLSVIDSLYPRHALLESKQRVSFDAVFDRAVVKVSVEPFSGGYGRQVSSAISRYLLDNVPNEVRMVSHDQFQRLSRSQQQSQSYFLVKGEILRTDVQNRERPRSEKHRAVTSTELGPNPLYKAWRDLPRAERTELQEPPKEANLPVYENVMIKHRDITSKAMVSVSYQVVDPVTAKVLFVETLSDSASVEATATEGMVQGMYVLEAVPAVLPSSAEMLDSLALAVSEKIGQELAGRLLALESRYEAAARGQKEQGNDAAALDQWVYAYVVSEPGSENQAMYRLAMEEAVLGV
jgi:hypothetical protein